MIELYNIHKSSIWLLFLMVFLVILVFKFKNKESFYLSFFPPSVFSKRTTLVDDTTSKPNSISFENKNILFKFGKGTSRENMIHYIGTFLTSKVGGVYKNVIDIKIERNSGKGSDFYTPSSTTDIILPGDAKKPEENLSLDYKSIPKGVPDSYYENVFIHVGFLNDTLLRNPDFNDNPKLLKGIYSISSPSVNSYQKIPLEFVNEGAVLKIKDIISPGPIRHFLHYWFDEFYCKGRFEKDLDVSGKETTTYPFVIPVDDLSDCMWDSCKLYKDKELIPEAIHVEPDSNTIQRKYKTPRNTLNSCATKDIYFKNWDGRGVAIEKQQKNVEMKEFIFHPSMVQNKLDGLYDDVFDMSRIIPSFPTGRTSVGR